MYINETDGNKYIKIDGVFDITSTELDLNMFMDIFIWWVESVGIQFCGCTKEVKDI